MLLFYILTTSLAFGAGGNCAAIQSHRDFYACSLQKHPLSEVAGLKAKEGEAFLEQAGQWRNPDLDLRTVTGDRAGEKVGSTELTVAIPLTQLWTRGARTSVAEAEKKRSEIDAKDMLLGVKKDLIRDIYRLRQIDDERALLDETLTTFAKIGKQLRGRRARGPEQEVTLSLVELAASDYELKKNRLETEKLEIASRMKGIWGSSFEVRPQFLPPPKSKWPSIDGVAAEPSLEVQRALADAEKSAAEKKLAERESWPELRVGPAIERATDGPNQFYSYGVTMSITLPVLSWNGGSRKLADTRAEQARFVADYMQKKSRLENEIHLRKYQSALSSMKSAASKDDLHRKHDRVENLFRQGLLPGSLVIEAHRQLYEYTVSQHEHENAAVDAFLELKTLRGEDVEEILQ